jgi:hypothetical protein
MSQGKYSPVCPHARKAYEYKFNCYKELPAPWTKDVEASGVKYDEKTMFANYDSEGFDSYGYSAFDAQGNYVGIGSGVDRLGYTEYQYLSMDPDDFIDIKFSNILN